MEWIVVLALLVMNASFFWCVFIVYKFNRDKEEKITRILEITTEIPMKMKEHHYRLLKLEQENRK